MSKRRNQKSRKRIQWALENLQSSNQTARKEAEKFLREAMKSTDPDVKITIAEEFIGGGYRRGGWILSVLLRDGDACVRDEVVQCIAAGNRSETKRLLLSALNDSDEFVRISALEGIRDHEFHNIEDSILPLFDDDDPLVKSLALDVLAVCEPKLDNRLYRILAAQLRNRDDLVRASALEAVGALRCRALYDDVCSALTDDRALSVRIQAAGALGDMGLKKAIPVLMRQLSAEHRILARVWIARALFQLGSREITCGIMAQGLSARDWVARAAAANFLMEYCGEDDPARILQLLKDRLRKERKPYVIDVLSENIATLQESLNAQ